MADKKISALTGATTPLAGTEVLPIVQGSTTVKVSVDNLTTGKTVAGLNFKTNSATALGQYTAKLVNIAGAQTMFAIENSTSAGQLLSWTHNLSTDEGTIGTDYGGPFSIKTGGVSRITTSSVGAVKFTAYGAGALTTDASGNITAASDERLKQNIRPFTKGLAEIVNIANDPNGVILYAYTFESGLDQTKNDYAGWSAQVIKKYIPEAVGEMPDGYLTLNPYAILAAQTNAIAELKREIDLLKLKTA